MKVLIVADLHLDLWARAGRDPLAEIAPVFDTLDGLIIAGDLANNPIIQWPKALAHIGRLIDPQKVYVFPGNHDYWSLHLNGDNALAKMATDAGMNFAQKRVLDIGTWRFLCCTLWTDFNLTNDKDWAMRRAAVLMPDYTHIRRTRLYGSIDPADTVAIHRNHLRWLAHNLAAEWQGQRIVVTHHAPSAGVAGPIDGLSPAFASNLEAWIGLHRPHFWFFGHTHRPRSAKIHGVPVTNISLGYPEEIARGQEAEVLLRGLISSGY